MKTLAILSVILITPAYLSSAFATKETRIHRTKLEVSPDDTTLPTQKTANKDSNIYKDVDKAASFKGGDGALMEFLQTNLNYPNSAINKNWQGRVLVKFVVDTLGHISNVEIQKSSGYPILDEEAIRVIKKTDGKYTPAEINGKKVKSYCQIPILFKIEE